MEYLDVRQRAMFIIENMRLEGYLKREMIDRCAEALQKLDQWPSPWEFAIRMAEEHGMDSMAANGWEFVSICGSGNDHVIWRRRKAVSDGK